MQKSSVLPFIILCLAVFGGKDPSRDSPAFETKDFFQISISDDWFICHVQTRTSVSFNFTVTSAFSYKTIPLILEDLHCFAINQ